MDIVRKRQPVTDPLPLTQCSPVEQFLFRNSGGLRPLNAITYTRLSYGVACSYGHPATMCLHLRGAWAIHNVPIHAAPQERRSLWPDRLSALLPCVISLPVFYSALLLLILAK